MRLKMLHLILAVTSIGIPLSYGQDVFNHSPERTKPHSDEAVKTRFIATTALLDAAINSLNSINSLVKKENYRNKIAAFNNPSSSDMGFSLETEIFNAIRPILNKTKTTSQAKFSEIISTLIGNPAKNKLHGNIFNTGTVFNTLLSMVGNLAINEKKITRGDVDSFMVTIGKYFSQYEKLKEANVVFDTKVDKFNLKLQELQFDIREFMMDLVTILHPGVSRQHLKNKILEELLLKYLDKAVLDTIISNSIRDSTAKPVYYPGDGIKTSKEVVYSLQKLFNEYQNIYTQNYTEIRMVLLQTKDLGKNINVKQVDQAVAEFDQLYKESKEADVLNLRLNTLSERLKYLVSTENLTTGKN